MKKKTTDNTNYIGGNKQRIITLYELFHYSTQ